MDGNGPSVDFDRAAGVTIRRLGGNLMTPYDWRDNSTNAGKDYRHANGPFLLEILGIPKERWKEPGAVVEAFLANSASVGARSLLTLPLAGFVAADFDGEVERGAGGAIVAVPGHRLVRAGDGQRQGRYSGLDQPDGRPSRRRGVARRRRLLSRQRAGAVARHPSAHRPGAGDDRSLIDRSLRAAAAIKAVDPDALVLGPASWGAPEFVDFRNAPDWDDFKQHGSFLGAYLDAFRHASEREGCRLLDALDLHWYPFSRRGDLFRAEDAKLSGAILDAPRSFDEAGFCENSWVADSLGCRPREGLFLPLLPSLKAIVDEKYPGTGLSFGEFNFGGAGLLASGLAVADALGRFGRFGVSCATHWGSLAGFIGEAYRLYRQPDAGERFGETALPVAGAGPDLSLFAARSEKSGRLSLVAINRSEQPAAFDLALASGRAPALRAVAGFDGPISLTRRSGGSADGGNAAIRLALPGRAARRYSLA